MVHAAGLKQIPPASVACLVGTALNPTSSRTLWGEMAYQLGGDKLYRLVAKADELKVTPGTDTLGQLLAEAGPRSEPMAVYAAIQAVPKDEKLPPISLSPDYLKQAGRESRLRVIAAGIRLGVMLGGNPNIVHDAAATK